MSRVSRLAEIRKRRDAKSGNDGLKEGGGVKNDVSSELNAEIKLRDTGSRDEVADNEKDAADVVQQTATSQQIPDALASDDQERLYREIYDQTGVFESEGVQTEKAISYNSDLKEDLAPLYERARHGTERAINVIIQKKYQESVGHSE